MPLYPSLLPNDITLDTNHDSYGRFLQIVGSNLYDGFGHTVSIIDNTPPGDNMCCDVILKELDNIKDKLKPVVIYKDKIITQIVIQKEPAKVITKYETKYIIKTIDKFYCPGGINPKPTPKPTPDQVIIVNTQIADSDCDNYRYRLKESMIKTKSYWLSKPDRKPYEIWSLSTYELNVDRNIDLSRPPGCNNKKIAIEVFEELFG